MHMLKFKRDTFVRRGDGSLVSLNDLGTLEHIGPLRDTLPVIGRDLDARPSQIPDAGTGVYTTRVFAKGEIVSWYSGAIITFVKPENLSLALRSHARALMQMRYTILGNVMEDGRHMVTELRGRGAVPFMNAAHGSAFRANAEFSYVENARNEQINTYIQQLDPHERIVVAVATRKIARGEEVFMDYGVDYWKRDAVTAAPGAVDLADVAGLLAVPPAVAASAPKHRVTPSVIRQ
jgi:hypothetical protein